MKSIPKSSNYFKYPKARQPRLCELMDMGVSLASIEAGYIIIKAFPYLFAEWDLFVNLDDECALELVHEASETYIEIVCYDQLAT